MGRYDSPLSVVTLFVAATVVSVGLIYLIDAETESRLQKEAKQSPASPLSSNSIEANEKRRRLEEESMTTTTTTTKMDLDHGLGNPLLPSPAPHYSSNVFQYFGQKLRDLFRRHHHPRSRRSATESELISLPFASHSRRISRRMGREVPPQPGGTQPNQAHQDDPHVITGHNRGKVGHFGDGRSGSGGYGGGTNAALMAASPSSPMMTPPGFSSSASSASSSGFHKIRHAIKKLDGGGLDLSLVERMILDSNPGRFRASSAEHQETERKSNYHPLPYTTSTTTSNNNNNNNNHKLPNKVGLHQNHHHHQHHAHPPPPPPIYPHVQRSWEQEQQQQHHQQPWPNPPQQPRLMPLGGEKLDGRHNATREKIISSSRGGGDGKDSPSSSSGGIEFLPNRSWKSGGNNHNLNSNDNEGDNTFQLVSKLSDTTLNFAGVDSLTNGTRTAAAATTTTTGGGRSGGRKSGKVGNPLSYNSSSGNSSHDQQQQHPSGKGRNGNRGRKKSSFSTSSSSSSTLSSPTSLENSSDPSNFHRSDEQREKVNEKRRKTNDMNSRLGFSSAFDTTHHHHHPQLSREDEVVVVAPEPEDDDDDDEIGWKWRNSGDTDTPSSRVSGEGEPSVTYQQFPVPTVPPARAPPPYDGQGPHGSDEVGPERHRSTSSSQSSSSSSSSGSNHNNYNNNNNLNNNSPGSSNNVEGSDRHGDPLGSLTAVVDGESSRGRLELEGNTLWTDTTKRSILKEDVPICYKTDDVLIVVAITCCLNFAFVLVVWGCVRWFSISSTSKERDFHQLDCEDGGESIIFHEDHDHEDCCWRPGSPLNFEGDRSTKCDDEGDGLDVRHEVVHCRGGSRWRGAANGSQCKLGTIAMDSPGAFPAGGIIVVGHGTKGSSPLFATCTTFGETEDDMGRSGGAHRMSSILRKKPSDRFHFDRQKQYQKNLREFGLGFGPPLLPTPPTPPPLLLTSVATVLGKSDEGGGIPKASASMYCFTKSDVPPQLQHALRSSSREKFYSHSMEDLRCCHT